MTGLSLRNPIAILMLALGLLVFSMVVTPRMAVDTFLSELTLHRCSSSAPWHPASAPRTSRRP